MHWVESDGNMNLVKHYNNTLAEKIVDFREKTRLSVQWMQTIKLFYISVGNDEDGSTDAMYAYKLGISVETYRGLLIKYGGTPGENINFDERGNAHNARDAIAFYVIIERRLRNESNRSLCPK
jgi:hypothetical protein